MNRNKYSAFILATALLIIGMRGVCMAQFSEHVSIERSDSQECNDVQLSIPVNKSTDFQLFDALRSSPGVSDVMDQGSRGGFNFRVKRYVYVPPAYQHIGVLPALASPPDVSLDLVVLHATASPPDVSLDLVVLHATASPPDVRRGSAPPGTWIKDLGYALGSGLPEVLWAKPGPGAQPKILRVLTAGRSPASHPAAKPRRLDSKSSPNQETRR